MFRLVFAAALIAVAVPASAQVNCQRYGGQVYCNNGLSSQSYGNSTYYYDNGRSIGNSQTYGNSTFYNFTPPPAPIQPFNPAPRTYGSPFYTPGR